VLAEARGSEFNIQWWALTMGERRGKFWGLLGSLHSNLLKGKGGKKPWADLRKDPLKRKKRGGELS